MKFLMRAVEGVKNGFTTGVTAAKSVTTLVVVGGGVGYMALSIQTGINTSRNILANQGWKAFLSYVATNGLAASKPIHPQAIGAGVIGAIVGFGTVFVSLPVAGAITGGVVGAAYGLTEDIVASFSPRTVAVPH